MPTVNGAVVTAFDYKQHIFPLCRHYYPQRTFRWQLYSYQALAVGLLKKVRHFISTTLLNDLLFLHSSL